MPDPDFIVVCEEGEPPTPLEEEGIPIAYASEDEAAAVAEEVGGDVVPLYRDRTPEEEAA